MKKRKSKMGFLEYIDTVSDKFVDWYRDFSKKIATGKIDDVIKMLFKLMVALLMIFILNGIFNLIEYLFANIVSIIPSIVSGAMLSIFNILFRNVFLLISMMILLMFIDNIKFNNSNIRGVSMFSTIKAFLRSISAILLIPLSLVLIFTLFIFVLLIINMFKGIYLISSFVMLLSILGICVTTFIFTIKYMKGGRR